MSTPQIDPLAEYAASFIAQLKLEGKDINEIIGILEADGAPQESDADAGEKESEADKAAVKKSNNIKTDTIGESEAHAGVKRKRSEAAADVEKPKSKLIPSISLPTYLPPSYLSSYLFEIGEVDHIEK